MPQSSGPVRLNNKLESDADRGGTQADDRSPGRRADQEKRFR